MAIISSRERDVIPVSILPEPRVLAMGIGGVGNDLLTHLMDYNSDGVFCVATDTDRYHLQIARAHSKLLIESERSSDSGTGGDVDAARDAALQMSEPLRRTLQGADVVFVLAGMGGGTGGGAAPIISDLARKSGSLVVALVTMPSRFEPSIFRTAIDNIRRMINSTDTVVLIDDQPSASPLTLPNRLNPDEHGQVCYSVVSSITDVFKDSNNLNRDSTALRSLLRRGGLAKASVGDSYSPWGIEAAMLAVLRNSMALGHLTDAHGIFVDVIGNDGLSDAAIGTAIDFLTPHIGRETELMCRGRVDEKLRGMTRVQLLATGVGFPYDWGGYRRVPFDLYDLEPESAEEESIDLALDLQQLEG
jgi:cell division protein FtsZ